MKRFKLKEFFFYLFVTVFVLLGVYQLPSAITYQLALFLLGFSWRLFTETEGLMNRAASKDVRFSFIRIIYLINKATLYIHIHWLRKGIQVLTPYLLLFVVNWLLSGDLSVETCLYGSLFYEILQYFKKIKYRFLPNKNGSSES